MNPQSRASLGQHNLKERKKIVDNSMRATHADIVAVADRALKERLYVIYMDIGYV